MINKFSCGILAGYQRTICSVALLVSGLTVSSAAELNATKSLNDMLDSSVYKAPKMHRLPALDQGAVQAIYYETLSYKGKETRAFAYLGIPDSDKLVPAMVLVHGGGDY